jgi:transcriptional regulator with XRE-family HTH domain
MSHTSEIEEFERLSKSFPKVLRQEMLNAGFRSVDLAEAIGVDQEDIEQFLSGKEMPTPAQLVLIAHRLTTSTDYLLGLAGVKHPVSELTQRDKDAICYIGAENKRGVEPASDHVANSFDETTVETHKLVHKLIRYRYVTITGLKLTAGGRRIFEKEQAE